MTMAMELLSTLNHPYRSTTPVKRRKLSVEFVALNRSWINLSLVISDVSRSWRITDRDGKIHLGYVNADDVDLLCEYLPKNSNVKFYAESGPNFPWRACWLRPGYPEYLEYL